MSDLFKSPTGSPAPADPSQCTPTAAGKKGKKTRILMTPGSPHPGNGTLLGFPGMQDFMLSILPESAKLSVPKKKGQAAVDSIVGGSGEKLHLMK